MAGPFRLYWSVLDLSHPAPPHHRDTTDLDVMLPPMPEKKKPRRRQISHGRRIEAARIVSVGQDRDTGEAIIWLRDADGKLVALCLPPRQFGTLARGLLGLATARGLVVRLSTVSEPRPRLG